MEEDNFMQQQMYTVSRKAGNRTITMSLELDDYMGSTNVEKLPERVLFAVVNLVKVIEESGVSNRNTTVKDQA